MTDTQTTPETEPAKPASSKGQALLLWVGGGGYLALAVAVAHLYSQPPIGPELAAFEDRLDAMELRLTAAEQRPAATGSEPAPIKPAPATDLGPLLARLESLERRPPVDLSALQGRIAALEQQQRAAVDVDGLAARLTALEKTTQRGTQLARLQAAAAALTAGQKLGDILGAPPALARFANKAPPTEAGLRLTYPAAERAALDAAKPETDDRPIMDRLLSRASSLVTIRQGDRVLVGDPAAGVLAKARLSVEAGDLAGAIAALSQLHGASAEAMAPWIADATALRDARQALAELTEAR